MTRQNGAQSNPASDLGLACMQGLAASWIARIAAADGKCSTDGQQPPAFETVSTQSASCCEELMGHVQAGSLVLLKVSMQHILFLHTQDTAPA